MAEHVQRLVATTDAGSLIEQVLCARQLRSSILGTGLFSDPAWDIVLTLYLGQLRGETVSIAHLAEAASISANAAYRWLEALEREGLIELGDGLADAKDFHVELTHKGSSAMRRWLAQWLNCPCAPAQDSEVTNLLGRILGSSAG